MLIIFVSLKTTAADVRDSRGEGQLSGDRVLKTDLAKIEEAVKIGEGARDTEMLSISGAKSTTMGHFISSRQLKNP